MLTQDNSSVFYAPGFNYLQGLRGCVVEVSSGSNGACLPCCVLAGDVNGSGAVNIADITYLIARIFSGGPPAFCCAEGDANGNAPSKWPGPSIAPGVRGRIAWRFARTCT